MEQQLQDDNQSLQYNPIVGYSGTEEQNYNQIQNYNQEQDYGPRRLTFFMLVLKTFAGFGGGVAGTAVLILIFLATSSILQPVLGGTFTSELEQGQVSPLFMVVLMAMVFATSLVASLLGPFFISYTERDRYNRVSTMMGQIFIANIVVFAFVLPIYLTTSIERMELTFYAASLQVIFSSIASALIMEILHDSKYPLLAVYNSLLALLVSVGVVFMAYYITGSVTIILFLALPVIWSLIGFAQATVTIFYFWIFQNWGTDFLANTATFGADYGVESEEAYEEEEVLAPDTEGSDFLDRA